jgi:hypothetical protein
MSLAGVISRALDSSIVTEGAAAALGFLLDPLDSCFGFLLTPVHEEPAWALGQVLANEENHEPQRRADQEGHPPRVTHRQVVHHKNEEQRGDERATPVRPVDGDVDPAPVLGRDELVDGRVDGRVLTTDPHTGDEAGDPDPVDPSLRVPEGQRSHHATEQVHTQGDHEQVPPAELVGHPAEEECAGDLAEQVDRPDGEGHFRGREIEGGLLADEPFGVAGDRDLEAVQYPCHTESDDQTGVESRPAQAVEPGGYQAPDRSIGTIVPARPSQLFRGNCRHVSSPRK